MRDKNIESNVAYNFYIKNYRLFDTFLKKYYMIFNNGVYLPHLKIFIINFRMVNRLCTPCNIYNIDDKLYFEYEDENIFKEIDKNIIVDENFYLKLFS